MPDETRNLDALAEALRGLKPASSLDRDRLMYEAGRAARTGRRWFWPACTAASLLLATGLAAARWLETPAERIVYLQAPARAPEPRQPASIPGEAETPRDEAASRLAYLALREQVLREGVESLPPPASAPASKRVRRDELLNHY